MCILRCGLENVWKNQAYRIIIFVPYEVQLNCYALIGEKVGFSPVSGLGLCYYEPQTQIDEKTVNFSLIDDGFTMPFKAHLIGQFE